MSNKMLTLMMGFVAFLILAVGLVFVIALAGGGGDDDDTPAGDDGERPAMMASARLLPGVSAIARRCSFPAQTPPPCLTRSRWST
jgi:hypothetical protein